VQARVLELLDDLQRELGFAYLFVSHDLGVVRQVSARVAVMYLGKLMEVAPTERVYAAPAHPYTAALLAAVPRRDPRAASAPRRGASGAEAPSGEPPSGAEAPSGCVFHPRCPRATDVCRAVEPPLTAYPDGRVAACHHPLDVTPEDLAAATRSPASPRSAGAAAPSPVS
jgi:peptide/nickel transport system ATP-binding protein/oligopeptide transport system ATP-binding protein